VRVDPVPPAGAGEAAEDRRGDAAPRVADEQAVLAVERHALHFSLADVVVDRHRAVGSEDAQLRPLIQRVTHRLGYAPPFFSRRRASFPAASLSIMTMTAGCSMSRPRAK